ncbi:iron-dicitrate ABC transporter (permease) [Nostocoides japonicum T1-X7]|uniref:Iron-dicitrate ABC transporter (Permease) n=1 Tax=Nostocoides japonicum T1-X7 TaxID=1194083 RepID=A0A077LTI4_9MICO|nr:iron chelate uptake ABC transporter family permease subunit [Tetrasphaera japonica]CCH76853.1 iron-dicitrate ABC transporter (permease) [Tetrasphaera japonica T1-X7]
MSAGLDTAPATGGTTAPAARRGVTAARLLGLVVAGGLLLLVVLLSIAVGAKPIPLSGVIHALTHGEGSVDGVVILDLRLPRTVLGVAVGAALAVAGVLMQALTRNPLADPGILGVNAGAAVAVVFAIWIWRFSDLTDYVWFAFLGAGAASVLVYLLGSRGRSGATPVRLALAGTAVSAVLGAVISFITLLNPRVFDQFRFWGVGALSGVDADVIWQVLPFLVLGTVLALGMSGSLNALALGDETARALGSNVGLTRALGAVAVTLLCGAATAAVGPIGFVGLTVPHMARVVTGPDHRWLVPYSILLGPILLLGSDIVGRVIARPGEIQVGIITAFVGAPVFIALVRRRRIPEL